MKIAYVFTEGRKKRLKKIDNGELAPREFLFGLTELREIGHEVDIFELSDFSIDKNTFINILTEKKNNYLTRFTGLTSSSHRISSEKLKRLNQYDIVIAGNEYVALGLAYYRRKNVFSTPLVFFVMGMLSKIQIRKENSGKIILDMGYLAGKKKYLELIEESSKILFLGMGEYKLANVIYRNYSKKFELMPFPVDTEFWVPGEVSNMEEYVLFIGNDQQRDFQLLKEIAFLSPEIQYIFITRQLDSSEVSENVTLIRGDWREEYLSDEKICDLIQRSALVILPLVETYQPSGQSVCQQSMACGKTVLISDTKGFWMPDLLINNENLVLIKEKSPICWVEKIRTMLLDKKFREKIGNNAFRVMNTTFSLKNYGLKLQRCLETINSKG